MRNKKVIKLVMAAMFAALVFAATRIVQIPVPTGGYIHAGDAVVILSGLVLGPVSGGLAAAVGSALADILSGFAQFAPATFFIKGVAAATCGLIFSIRHKKHNGLTETRIKIFTAGIAATALIALGYFTYEAYILGLGMGAAAELIPNALQGLTGTVISVIAAPVLIKAYRKSIK